jgi:hypothetical protein
MWQENHLQAKNKRPALYKHTLYRKKGAVPPLKTCRLGRIHQGIVGNEAGGIRGFPENLWQCPAQTGFLVTGK